MMANAFLLFLTDEVSFINTACSGHFTSENLTDTFKELLCSPASRVDKPDPVQFLKNLERPRFSGEDTSSMSVSELQAIMRGDILKDLGVSICFMLRFALMVEDDPLLEYKPISHTQIFPSMHEQDMQTTDVTFELPGIVIPGIDQDIDVNGNNINRIRGLMDVYTKFPFEDDPHYFQSKAEYFAFYRWELVSDTTSAVFLKIVSLVPLNYANAGIYYSG